ncbi:Uncharacterised protein [Mycobacteroides abscessus subsp. abscessus]|nr:Uncharacterised protein [Mycobacteroides abscessus subsp. abscessus]
MYRTVSQHQTRDHHGDHAGTVNLLGQQVGEERHHQTDGALGEWIVELAADDVHQFADDKSDEHPTDGRERENPEPVGHGGTQPDRRGDSNPVGGERGGVVEQTLAAQQRHDVARQAQAPANGGGRNRVRWGHDGAEHHRTGQGQLGYRVERHEAHCDGGNQRKQHREAGDRPDVLAQVDVRAFQRRRVEQRGQDHEQHKVRIHLDGRQTWDGGGCQTGYDQYQRGSKSESAGNRGQNQRGREYRQQ